MVIQLPDFEVVSVPTKLVTETLADEDVLLKVSDEGSTESAASPVCVTAREASPELLPVKVTLRCLELAEGFVETVT